MTSAAIVSVRGLSKRFSGVTALDAIDLDIRAKEVLALVGDNGAGKSTLLKILAGAQQPSSGQLLIDGEPVVFRSPIDATRAGIATVYQDLALAGDLDVVSNMFLGRELFSQGWLGRFGWLNRAGMRQQTRQALEKVRIRIPDLATECRLLSGGQRQAVAIARAVSWCDRALLLDEPTAALGVEQQREVLSLIERVRETGIGVVLVSHQLPHVLEVADRIAVLRRGRIAGVIDRHQATSESLLALITGLEAGTAAPAARMAVQAR